MMDAALRLAAEADVERGHSGVVEEGSVIAAVTERTYAKVSATGGLAVLRLLRVGDAPQLGAPLHAQLGLGVGHVARHGVDHRLQRVRARRVQKAARV